MNMAYRWDVFISYCSRESHESEWVRNHFKPELRRYLGGEMAYEPQVFVDYECIPLGADFQEEMDRALLSTKIMIPVWSPGYWRSRYCKAEYYTLKQREEQFRKQRVPPTLILPVVYAGVIHVPLLEQKRQYVSFQDGLNHPQEGFRNSQRYLELQTRVERIALRASQTLGTVPPWDDRFPLSRPDDHTDEPIGQFAMPRLEPAA